MNTINKNVGVAEVVKSCPNARRIFDRHGLKGRDGEHGPGVRVAGSRVLARIAQVPVCLSGSHRLSRLGAGNSRTDHALLVSTGLR